MFFDPQDYLERDPAGAMSAAEAERLRREAWQRAKLCEAMTHRAAEVGIEATSAQWAFGAVELGSSTFYKLFGDKEACLLEAFERCAESIFARVGTSVFERKGGAECAGQLQAGLGELLGLLAAEPAVARFVLVEIRAGGTECREAQQRWLERFAGLLADANRKGGALRSESLARMTAGALATLLAIGTIEKGPEALPKMLTELACVGLWPQQGTEAEASWSPEESARDPEEEAPARPAGKGRAARLLRTETQRQLLLSAMTEVATEKGYGATRVADVLERSTLSRPVFYAHFGGKEKCFLAACNAALEPILERVSAAVANETIAADRAAAGLRALVRSLAEQPAVARLVIIEMRTAGAAGEERYSKALTRLGHLIAGTDPGRHAGEMGDVPRLVAGTVASLIARELGEGRSGQLEGLLPELLFTVLAPCMGGEKAAEEMQRIGEGAST